MTSTLKLKLPTPAKWFTIRKQPDGKWSVGSRTNLQCRTLGDTPTDAVEARIVWEGEYCAWVKDMHEKRKAAK